MGSPLSTLADRDEERAIELREATHDALTRVIDVAIEREVDFVVVSGDLYDERARSIEANEFLID